jgi:hypothetical protein
MGGVDGTIVEAKARRQNDAETAVVATRASPRSVRFAGQRSAGA